MRVLVGSVDQFGLVSCREPRLETQNWRYVSTLSALDQDALMIIVEIGLLGLYNYSICNYGMYNNYVPPGAAFCVLGGPVESADWKLSNDLPCCECVSKVSTKNKMARAMREPRLRTGLSVRFATDQRLEKSQFAIYDQFRQRCRGSR